MNDKEGPCPSCCFVKRVTPSEQSLEDFLTAHQLTLVADLDGSNVWNVCIPFLSDGVSTVTAFGADLNVLLNSICESISWRSLSVGGRSRSAAEVGAYNRIYTGKIVPGDLAQKVMAA